MRSLIHKLALGWRRAPLPFAIRRLVSPMVTAMASAGARIDPPARSAGLQRSMVGGLVFSGFMTEVLGLGSAARRTVQSLRSAGLDPLVHDLSLPLRGDPYATFDLPGGPGGVWICHCNPPEMLRLLNGLPQSSYSRRYRIGIWAWELEVIPPDWVSAAAYLDEIWAPSAFVRHSVERGLRALPGSQRPKVVIAPHPGPSLSNVVARPERPDPHTDDFIALSMFDLRSTRARKNPEGVLAAWRLAFDAPQAGRRLIMKVVGGDALPTDLLDLTGEIERRSDIQLLTDHLSDQETLSLMAGVDAFVSLHRSEGYGLAIAEAMHLRKVVIATGWSGPMDFIDPDCAEVIPYRMVPVVDQQHHYDLPGACWAEPDVSAAAAALRRVAADRQLRRRLGERAHDQITSHERLFQSMIEAAPWISKIDMR